MITSIDHDASGYNYEERTVFTRHEKFHKVFN